MVLKRNITEEELLVVMLSCDWNNPDERVKFASRGYFLNVLIKDNNQKVQWVANQFLALEEYDMYKFKKDGDLQRSRRRY